VRLTVTGRSFPLKSFFADFFFGSNFFYGWSSTRIQFPVWTPSGSGETPGALGVLSFFLRAFPVHLTFLRAGSDFPSNSSKFRSRSWIHVYAASFFHFGSCRSKHSAGHMFRQSFTPLPFFLPLGGFGVLRCFDLNLLPSPSTDVSLPFGFTLPERLFQPLGFLNSLRLFRFQS